MPTVVQAHLFSFAHQNHLELPSIQRHRSNMRSHDERCMAAWFYRATGVVCLLLILLTGFVAAVHIHPGSSNAPEHSCSICALAHTGVISVQSGPPAPLFTSSGFFETISATSHSLLLVTFLYIRPPPAR